jgi:alpha-tubulin suppressor-like RCC1 family protein
MISKAIKLLEVGAVEYVNSLSELPDPVLNAGRLYFVFENGLYWSTGATWLSIVVTSLFQTWSWGYNNLGQLGDNTIANRSSPVLVIGEFTDWCQVSTIGNHSLGLRTNGTAWAWGRNFEGQVGSNSSSSGSVSPVSVVGDFSDWRQVSGGYRHSLALRSNGTAWAWGSNGSGQLGTNNTISRSSPVSVLGEFTDWCQVSAGGHSLGLRTNGTVWAWGSNYSGQLGTNNTTSRSSPVSVVGGFTDWCQVSAGVNHSLGVRTNGTLWAWGYNSFGQLGINVSSDRSSPVSVVGGFTDWCQVSSNIRHNVGLRTNGTAWAWGYNGSGQIGDNTGSFSITRFSPVSVVGGFTDWCQVAAGGGHSLGLKSNGTIWAWGTNSDGRLGTNNTINRSSPVSVVGGFTDWCQVTAGGGHNLGIRAKNL